MDRAARLLGRINTRIDGLAAARFPLEMRRVNARLAGASHVAALLSPLQQGAIGSPAMSERVLPLLVFSLASPAAAARDDIVVLAAVLSLMRRANWLHAKGRLLGLHPSQATPPGQAAAVLGGDLCMSIAFKLLAGLRSMPVMNVFARTALRMAEGDARQLESTASQEGADALIVEGAVGLHVAAARCVALLAPACTSVADAVAVARCVGLIGYALERGCGGEGADSIAAPLARLEALLARLPAHSRASLLPLASLLREESETATTRSAATAAPKPDAGSCRAGVSA